MLKIQDIHHIAIIASDYERSKRFYCDVMGFTLLHEVYRASRDSWKGDLALNGHYLVELFSFHQPPTRVSRPEACGLRHLAFFVEDIEQSIAELTQSGVICEPLRVDEETQRRFTFFSDPDGLPLELYER
ncbi:VOC family protein [Prodigiosinella confusarubida]|uniref:VOC family protein n=1 Tax=Serratia sp. (strain ATCC 39006) TaxID=104623 RepID=A0A2I5TNG4_SERS3|nr:VOC family protein [Serratia sp. ATCC 39006]AUH01779.1 VOC family protein [Serratia sp. ATCC 39006]AUH06102.1 VOC family protein [Serratia sp. ATCC 39006]